MSFQFTAGTTNRWRRDLLAQRDRVLERAQVVMSAAVENGAVKLQDGLEAAVTKTGEFRETYLGGLPGRHLTGEMVGSIGYEGEDGVPFEADGDHYVYAFGWFPGDFKDYFYQQDVGEGNIPAANAMEPAYTAAKQYVRQHMRQAVA